MMQDQKRISAQVFSAVYGQHEVGLIESLFHPAYLQKPIGYAGQPGVRRHVDELRAAFPDLAFELIDQIGEDDAVVNLLLMTGTHAGPLFGHIPPTNRQVTVMAVVVHRFEVGQIVEGVVMIDELSLMQQLGVVPAPVWTGRAA